MIRLIIVASSLLVVATLVSQYKSTETTKINTIHNLQTSPLVAYGKAIFKREKCKNCHTLQVENQSKRLISLDGFSGKYPNAWLYYYLTDPKIVILDAKKKSYSHLNNKPLDKKLAHKVISNTDKEASWRRLNEEAQLIEDDLKSNDIDVKRTELIALLAYIQQIPASEKMIELDSLEQLKQLKEQEKWSGIILETVNNPQSEEKGRLLFQTYCASCHGMEGQGIIGPNLTDEYWLHGGEKEDIARTIIFGVPEKGMLTWKEILKPEQVGELIAFIVSIQGTKPENAKAPQGKKE